MPFRCQTDAIWFNDDDLPYLQSFPDSKVHVALMGPTWVLSAPGGPHLGPINLDISPPYGHITKSFKCVLF